MKTALRLSMVLVLVLFTAFALVGTAQAQFTKGEVFAGVGNGTIKVFSQTGTLLQTLKVPGSSSEDTGMGFDNTGALYATLFEDSKVVKFDVNGNLVLNPFNKNTIVGHPESIVVDSAQNVYVGVTDSSTNILKYDQSGNLLATYTGLQGAPRGFDWIDLASNQTTMRYTGEGNVIKQANVTTPPGSQLADFATGLTGPNAFAHRILSDGGELVADSSQVVRLNSTGAVVHTYPSPAGETSILFALNLDPNGTAFWTAGFNSGNVYEIDIATGNILEQWNAGIVGSSLAGLAVFGEITQSNPTVPEPATMLLLGLGLLGLAGVARRRIK